MGSIVDELFNQLENNPELLARLRNLIGVELVEKKDLEPILEELRLQREETSANFERVWEEIARQREETSANFERVWKEMEKQREEMARQREENAAHFKRIWEEAARQREAMEKGFKTIHRRVDKLEDSIKSVAGESLEEYSRLWFKGMIEGRGLKVDNIVRRKHIRDEEKVLGTTDVELDIFQEEPLIAGEITTVLNDLTKITKFVKKLEVLERIYRKKPKGVFICYRIKDEIEDTAIRLLADYKILLISVGKRIDFSRFDWDIIESVNEPDA